MPHEMNLLVFFKTGIFMVKDSSTRDLLLR